MSLATKICALLTSLSQDQIAAMTPEERRLLQDQCQRVLSLSVIQSHLIEGQESGILKDLGKGFRSESIPTTEKE